MLPWSHPPPLTLTLSLSPLPHSPLSLVGRDLMKMFYLELSASKSLALCKLFSCGPRVNYYLLLEKASLMRIW